MPRWSRRCLLVVGLSLLVIGVVVADPRLGFAVRAPALRAALETSVTIVASLVALLLLGRFRRLRQPADLAVTVALGLLAFDFPVFGIIVLIARGPLKDVGAWTYLIVHASAAALLFWAGFSYGDHPAHTEGASGERTWAFNAVSTVAVTAFVCFLLLLFFGFDPDGHSVDVTARVLLNQPSVSAVRLIAFALLFGASMLFSRSSQRRKDYLIGWLAVGCALLAMGDLVYGLYPSHMPGNLHLGDVFRLAAVLVFATGAVAEIHLYWGESLRLARLEERRRVAADLHDSVAQELAFLTARTRSPAAKAQGTPVLEELRSAADRALAESRRAIAALVRDEALSPVGDLHDALTEVVEATGISLEVTGRGCWIDQLDDWEHETLIRIAREAVINAVRHGHPERITVEISDRPALLRIHDNGRGFAAGEALSDGTFGLTSMRERASAIGARCEIYSTRGGGTTVELDLAPRTGSGAVPASGGGRPRRWATVLRSLG